MNYSQKRMAAVALFIALSTTFVGCSGNDVNPQSETSGQTTEQGNGSTFKAGTYTATGEGNNGFVKVEVVLSDSKIESIKILESTETEGLGDTALDSLIEQIIANQSIGLDAVTGATNSSNALLAGVEACLVEAGADIEALKETVVKTGVNEEISTEIVVIGGGASGTAAALQAVEDGAKVTLVEMTASPAGQGTMAGGLFATDSTQQKEQGKTVAGKWFYDQFVDTANYQANGGLLSNVIKNSGDTVDWLIENGAELILAHPATGGYAEHKETHPSSTLHGYVEGGTQAITNLHESIVNKGGDVLYSTKATELIVENGEVKGIKAEKEDGGVLTILADAVILATGGFAGNEQLVEDVFGEGLGQGRIATNIGTGIEMAISAGAAASYEDAITMHYGVSRGGSSWGSALNSALINPWLFVDVDGNRFMNEESFIFEPIKTSNVIKSLPQMTGYQIFDQTLIDVVAAEGPAGLTDVFDGELATNPTKFIEVGHEIDTAKSAEIAHTPADVLPDIEELIEKGTIIVANSPEELAEKLNMNYIVDTINRYNELCEAGADTDHFKSSEYLDKLEGTLYAVKTTPSVFLGTLGGIDVNDQAEVLDFDGKPIKGLYAAGSDTNGAYGNSYVYFEGGTLGYAYGTGRIAGSSAASFINK
ncbi:MAG TPA: FAD-binding protein [Firmicutes bacterium]|nr:FAD-binding protein [Bacillota bacterium]